MDMDTCQLCQTKGPIEPCEFCSAQACSSDRTSGFCSVDESHEMHWCMDCEKILAKRKRAFRLICRDCDGFELPAALEKDIDRRYAERKRKSQTTANFSDLRILMWNVVEFLDEHRYASVIELDIDDFVTVADPDDEIFEYDIHFPALQEAFLDLGIEIERMDIGPFDSGSIMIHVDDDLDDVIDLM